MGIKARSNTTIRAINPTRGQVEVAARRFGAAFDWSQQRTKRLFDFAIGFVSTANAMIEYATLLVRSQVAETKLSIPISDRRRLELAEEPLKSLRTDLATAKWQDEKDGGTRLLESIPFGEKLDLSVPERHVVVEMLKTGFAPPSGTAVEEELYWTIVGRGGMSLQLADFIIRLFLDEAETVKYEDQLKAARAETAGSPAPEAEVEQAPSEEPEAASA